MQGIRSSGTKEERIGRVAAGWREQGEAGYQGGNRCQRGVGEGNLLQNIAVQPDCQDYKK